jgi:hypothetical protein
LTKVGNQIFWNVWRLKCEKVNRGQTTDTKWWQRLTWPLASWAEEKKNQLCNAML